MEKQIEKTIQELLPALKSCSKSAEWAECWLSGTDRSAETAGQMALWAGSEYFKTLNDAQFITEALAHAARRFAEGAPSGTFNEDLVKDWIKLAYQRSLGRRWDRWHRDRSPGWDGRCVTCGHDYLNGCHGDCTCLSCNVLRQEYEKAKAE